VVLLRSLVLALTLALALCSAAPAFGQSSLEGYGGQAGAEAGLTGETVSITETRSDGLPFTGLEVAVLAGIALVLVGSGIALRQLSAPRREQS
jgi:hypothetical protein